jgi:hypothetical protein
VPEVSGPEITLQREPLTSGTLATIAADVAEGSATSFRPKLDTIRYDERPRVRTPPPPPPSRPMAGSAPELITIDESAVGRATMAAITEELSGVIPAVPDAPAEAAPARRGELAPAEIFEIATFVVRGEEIFTKASDASRRAFVEQRLLQRLPVLSMNDVTRIDITRGVEAGTVVLRVWCRVLPPRTT